jgi:predicted alpha/beta superfamily hydrolase
MPFRSQIFSLVLAIIAGAAMAQPAPGLKLVWDGPYTPGGERRLVVHSATLDRDFVVNIAIPGAALVQPGQKLPAIYALDGGYGVAGPIGQMMGWSKTMAPAYVISIGYPEGQPNQRELDDLYATTQRGGQTVGGGGAAFAAFLTQELRPYLEQRYPLDPAAAILFGHSYGGLFTANVLAASPSAFAGYVIASPSVQADPALLQKLAASPPSGSAGQRVYVTAGGAEDPGMIAGANRIAALLAGPSAKFKVGSRVFPGQGHMAYYPDLVSAAFAWMLPPPAPAAPAPAAPTPAAGR